MDAARQAMIVLDPSLQSHPSPAKQPDRTALPSIPTKRTLARFLALAQASVKLRGEVSVLLTSDAAIRQLNRRFRHKNRATDVLSFPADPIPGIKAGQQPAGDIAISVPTAAKQAARHGHALGVELKVLMLHGLLHLAGHDHETDTGQMAALEAKLRTRLKLPLGLIERLSDPADAAPLKRANARTAKP